MDTDHSILGSRQGLKHRLVLEEGNVRHGLKWECWHFRLISSWWKRNRL